MEKELKEMNSQILADYIHYRFIQHLFIIVGPVLTIGCFYLSGLFINYFFGKELQPLFALMLNISIVEFMCAFGLFFSIAMMLRWLKR